MIRYEYEEFVVDIKNLATQINQNVDAIVAVSRGGFTTAHFLATLLENRNLFCINAISYDEQTRLDSIKIYNIPELQSYQNILIVDDIVDSGRTVQFVKQTLQENFPHSKFFIASIYYKYSACIQPDYWVKEANEWIEFFWEKF